jgi:hypothetical protein
MQVSSVQYVSDARDNTTGVVIPIEQWRRIQPLLQQQLEPTRTAGDTLDNFTGSVAAPHDWAAEHDHYLYGTPKHDAI